MAVILSQLHSSPIIIRNSKTISIANRYYNGQAKANDSSEEESFLKHSNELEVFNF